ncbi:MAG: ABC transporter ATP-binding protein, partial [Lachnospiraceae bacterium]|nr:ABC transporter ATP-binding protein [Lachnospiraceae bacterium]
VAVIFVGEDLDVLLEISDKILVLCGGRVSGIVNAEETDKNTVGLMMTKVMTDNENKEENPKTGDSDE